MFLISNVTLIQIWICSIGTWCMYLTVTCDCNWLLTFSRSRSLARFDVDADGPKNMSSSISRSLSRGLSFAAVVFSKVLVFSFGPRSRSFSRSARGEEDEDEDAEAPDSNLIFFAGTTSCARSARSCFNYTYVYMHLYQRKRFSGWTTKQGRCCGLWEIENVN